MVRLQDIPDPEGSNPPIQESSESTRKIIFPSGRCPNKYIEPDLRVFRSYPDEILFYCNIIRR